MVGDWAGSSALIVVDVQRGFDDAEYWGPRNNPDCEANVGASSRPGAPRAGRSCMSSTTRPHPSSPLAPGEQGQRVQGCRELASRTCLVEKTVHSAFYGEPDLDAWLRGNGITGVAVCGIQTNMCCETTARMASDLGYDLLFVEDATHTFDIVTPTKKVYRAREVARYSALSLCRLISARSFARQTSSSE